MAVWGAFTNSCEKKRSEKQKEKERHKNLNAEFQRIARKDKKAFLSDQCKETEQNKRSLVFPIPLLSSVTLRCSFSKAFLSLLAILSNSEHRWVYLSFFFFLPLASLLFSAICKALSDNHFASLHLFFLGMVLIPVQCHEPSSIVLQPLCLSDLIPSIYLSLLLYNR